MDKKAREKVKYLMMKIDIISKKMKKILIDCATSRSELLSYWSDQEKKLKENYEALKQVYYMISRFIIEEEYFKKLNNDREYINNLKSVKLNIKKDFDNKLIHKRTIDNLAKRAFNNFSVALETGYKKKINLLSDIQQAVIKANRVKNDTIGTA